MFKELIIDRDAREAEYPGPEYKAMHRFLSGYHDFGCDYDSITNEQFTSYT